MENFIIKTKEDARNYLLEVLVDTQISENTKIKLKKIKKNDNLIPVWSLEIKKGHYIGTSPTKKVIHFEEADIEHWLPYNGEKVGELIVGFDFFGIPFFK